MLNEDDKVLVRRSDAPWPPTGGLDIPTRTMIYPVEAVQDLPCSLMAEVLDSAHPA